jgi:hypothetical protein
VVAATLSRRVNPVAAAKKCVNASENG